MLKRITKKLTRKRKATPLIKFARFTDGILGLFESKPDELEYVAFSHVWGDWEWRDIPGIPYQVKASQEKADFIEKDLPTLVGNGAFWMDTLTVDQRNEVEVISVIESIPLIFRMAERTIAVREYDGLYDCCIDAVKNFQDHRDFMAIIEDHECEHSHYVCKESYLQRLWTLQECLMSKKIQFVNPKSAPKLRTKIDPHKARVDREILSTSLVLLALSCKGKAGVEECLRAYVTGGTIICSDPARTSEDDIHSGPFLELNISSRRSASMSRDYIYATMPQFPWYLSPNKDMTFGEIYCDLYKQAAKKGHPFTCRFTRSMMHPKGDSWLPSENQPAPSCLGDFLKLMGNRVPAVSNGISSEMHLTTVVQVRDLSASAQRAFDVLELSLQHFQMQWNLSHNGGELSKFGNVPSTEWKLNYADPLVKGWKLPENEHGVEPEIGAVSLLEQTYRILDCLWCWRVAKGKGPDWEKLKNETLETWPTPLLWTTLLVGAMIACRIPLSAVEWVNRYFVPVYVGYSKSFLALGLLARHARLPLEDRGQTRNMLSIGQHRPDKSDNPQIFQDHFLADLETGIPIGILPDFLTLYDTKDCFEMVAALYSDSNCGSLPAQVRSMLLPLEDLPRKSQKP